MKFLLENALKRTERKPCQIGKFLYVTRIHKVVEHKGAEAAVVAVVLF